MAKNPFPFHAARSRIGIRVERLEAGVVVSVPDEGKGSMGEACVTSSPAYAL
jgi:hypothetical protein